MKTAHPSRYVPAALLALVLTLIALFFIMIPPARAADVASAVPAELAALPTGNPTADTLLTWLTPIVVPIVLLGVKKVAPRIPGGVIPVLAPILGVLIDIVNHYGLGHASNLWIAAAAGLAGVGLREVKEAVKPAPNGGWPKTNDGAPAV